MSQDSAPGSKDAAESGPKVSSNLYVRFVAAAVLAPLTIGVVFAGGWLWILLATLIATGLYFEWQTIVSKQRNELVFAIGFIFIELIGLALWLGLPPIAFIAAVAGPVLVLLAEKDKNARWWNAGGLFYAAVALLASVLVRLDGAMGFQALVFIFLVVWATDIGGYFAGRTFGGPKLAPRISPKKTWAGAIGGVALSLVAALLAVWLGWGRVVPLLMLAVALSAISQLGDLFESAVKRRFDMKDSSQIIPGHGGLLDRLDGFVAAIIFAAIIGFMRGGLDGVGRGFMMW